MLIHLLLKALTVHAKLARRRAVAAHRSLRPSSIQKTTTKSARHSHLVPIGV
jgi:hypothetical protein